MQPALEHPLRLTTGGRKLLNCFFVQVRYIRYCHRRFAGASVELRAMSFGGAI
ncbi:MAG TPA: hypothetical protein VF898_06060 [Chloroflexota bacterium]